MAEGDRSEAGQKPDRPLELIDPMTNELLVARIHSARMISHSTQCVDMPIDGGYVGMVDREPFDEWLRERAARHGAVRLAGTFRRIERDEDGDAIVIIEPKAGGPDLSVRTRVILGTDGARSEVARQSISGADEVPFVYAYHEILHTPKASIDPTRCDVYYDSKLSPDFYAWVFPHGSTISAGAGTAIKGFSISAWLHDQCGCGYCHQGFFYQARGG